MYNEIKLVQMISGNSYDAEELETVFRRFRVGWCAEGERKCRDKQSLRRENFRKRKEKLFEIFFAEFVSWFDDRVEERKDELTALKYNYQNYRKPKRDERRRKICGPVQGK